MESLLAEAGLLQSPCSSRCPGAWPDGFGTAPGTGTAQPTLLGSQGQCQSLSGETDELYWKEAESCCFAMFLINAFCVSSWMLWERGCCGPFSVLNYKAFPSLRVVPNWLGALGIS